MDNLNLVRFDTTTRFRFDRVPFGSILNLIGAWLFPIIRARFPSSRQVFSMLSLVILATRVPLMPLMRAVTKVRAYVVLLLSYKRV